MPQYTAVDGRNLAPFGFPFGGDGDHGAARRQSGSSGDTLVELLEFGTRGMA